LIDGRDLIGLPSLDAGGREFGVDVVVCIQIQIQIGFALRKTNAKAK
jgi:hypothetical protein